MESYLELLAAARLIEKSGGLWREARVLSVDTRGDFARNRALKQHWARVAEARLAVTEPHHESLFSYNVFPISHADFVRLRELHVEYYQRVRGIVAAATGADRVVVMNIQLCALEEA